MMRLMDDSLYMVGNVQNGLKTRQCDVGRGRRVAGISEETEDEDGEAGSRMPVPGTAQDRPCTARTDRLSSASLPSNAYLLAAHASSSSTHQVVTRQKSTWGEPLGYACKP